MSIRKKIKKIPSYIIFILLLSSCLSVESGDNTLHLVESDRTPSPSATLVTIIENTNTPTATQKNEETPTQENIPSPTTPVSRCLLDGGKLTEGSLLTDDWEYPLDFIVYTPPCYIKDVDANYPVLYLIHGKTYRQDQWINLGAVEVADRLIASGEMAPMIMVMPRDRVWKQPSEDIFGEVLLDLLIPYIDETYRTKTDREFRGIGGVSRGGAWSLYLGLKNWDIFSIIGLHSPALFWDHTGMVPTWLAAIPPDKMPRIFVDVRKYEPWEIESSIIDIETGLNLFSIPHEFYRVDGFHNEDYWSLDIEKYMRFYTLDW